MNDTPDAREGSEPIRIQKFLSQAGTCSRRQAEAWLRQGRITINGQVITQPGTRINPLSDVVEVDGKHVRPSNQEPLVLMMNKPRSCVCTANDPEGRRTVHDFLSEDMPRLFTVGRLDYASQGLLIFTNDGELSNALMHPSTGIVREYEVKVKGHPTRQAIKKVAAGTKDPEGRLMVPLEVSFIRRTQKNCWYRILVTEGRYHEVRRIFAAGDLDVLVLIRVAYGLLRLDDLPASKTRILEEDEVRELRSLAGLEPEETLRRRHR